MNQIAFQPELAQAQVKLEAELDDLIQLRPLPAIAMKIMEACREQQTKVRELVKLVECDATVSSRILSVVNSSLYGYTRDINSINQAVVVLGFKNLTELAVSIASEKVFSDGDSSADSRMSLYEHSLGCAALARLLAGQPGSVTDTGAAFLAGMLHDVGKLVLFDVAPNYYCDLQSQPAANSTVEIERASFGIDHTVLGEKFGDAWELPPPIISALANHHRELDESADGLLQTTALANELAKRWGIGQSPSATECETTDQWLSSTDPAELEQLQENANQQYTELKSLLVN